MTCILACNKVGVKTTTILYGRNQIRSYLTYNCADGATRNFAYTQRRNISFLQRNLIKVDDELRSDLNHAVTVVKKYDPSGYLPGLLISSNNARIGYYAVRAFWIESGLRFQESPLIYNLSGQKSISTPDNVRIEMLKNGVNSLYDDSSDFSRTFPTLRLLKQIVKTHSLSKEHFDKIILGREMDINLKQYPTIDSLETHAEMFCVSLLNLILECGGVRQDCGNDNNTLIFDTAKSIGTMHGLTNALRLSVPTASSTGKVIVPQDLCEKYGVKSPRYLLSALSMGDEECKLHLQDAVKEITMFARRQLEMARNNREALSKHPNGSFAMTAFLPALASETFLDRLERHSYDLTDRSLRSVGYVEHMHCAQKLVKSSILKSF
jgi:phytoene/squalene synthetase